MATTRHGEKIMSTNRGSVERDRQGPSPHTSGPPGRCGRPTIRVRTVEGSTIVEVLDAEVLFAQDDITELAGQLRRLVEAGHTRLLLDFSGIRSMSSDVLGTLAGLHRQLQKVGGRLGLARPDPAIRDMLRICRLDRYLDVDPDEAGRGSRPGTA
jgi:anti-anti-sigma factor